MKKKIAIIFGVTGQDGYYLTKLLIKKIISSMASKEDLLQFQLRGLTNF